MKSCVDFGSADRLACTLARANHVTDFRRLGLTDAKTLFFFPKSSSKLVIARKSPANVIIPLLLLVCSSSSPSSSAKMALYQRAPFQTADSQQVIGDESDQEEDALVNDYQEQVQFDDGMGDLDRTPSMGGGGQLHDMQAQLAAAATPLEYQATLETKFASYDSYCNLFHYILNSEGPVDLEVPSVSLAFTLFSYGASSHI